MTDNKKYFTVAHAYRHSQAFHSHKKIHIDIINSPKVMLSIKQNKKTTLDNGFWYHSKYFFKDLKLVLLVFLSFSKLSPSKYFFKDLRLIIEYFSFSKQSSLKYFFKDHRLMQYTSRFQNNPI